MCFEKQRFISDDGPESVLGLSWGHVWCSWGRLGSPLGYLEGLLGGSCKGIGSSLGALGDVLGLETLYFQKMKASPRREHDLENLYYQGTGSETMRERLFARK